MSRKNLLTSITERKLTTVNSVPSSDKFSTALPPAMERNRNRGAFGAITKSIDELAEKAQAAKDFETKLLEGETVVDLDPSTIDASFIADRMDDDDEQAFAELVEAIRQRGQDSPILVRPHPELDGRYMTVFGHRRARAAKVLGRSVRAVVKELDDKDHVIAQGQENSARADLSFIEKAVFASNLEHKGYDREVIMIALSVDKTVVSKMISVTNDIPAEVVRAIGPAKNSGRDRWYRLAIKFREEKASNRSGELTGSREFQAADSDQRLELLTLHLENDRLKTVSGKPKQHSTAWAPADKTVSVIAKSRPKGFSFDLTQKDAKPFGEWISSNLDGLYESFRKQEKVATGD
ncbi:plasmid partitioning protein RepB (plasmid) [Aminobacter sp. SR38]|jgi:ParB family chromosome partitioning protein|uniref:plasmid partitioning protein RepB n=1 Tax=Aminobacter sp. SR38 TaxID=2774562 RepID=UPI00177EE9D2|nr:plasmid partitioning protein RepB [Aminobacter sp. SR38]QOF75049.1 plasmid partitioning protein RepB [Aminobacter sp. SR38]